MSATLDTAGGSHYRALLCARDHHLTKTQCDACKAVAKLLRGRVDVAFEPGAARNGKTLDAAQRQLGHDRAENSALRQELSHAHAQAASLSMLPQRAQLLVTDLQTALTKEPNLVGSMSFVQFETVLRKVNAGTIGGPRQSILHVICLMMMCLLHTSVDTRAVPWTQAQIRHALYLQYVKGRGATNIVRGAAGHGQGRARNTFEGCG